MHTRKLISFFRSLLRGRSESGQILMLTALSMPLFFAFLALAIDVGSLFRAKRIAQTAADAAAIAAALESSYGASGSCVTTACAAQAAAGLNGIPNPATNVILRTGSNITSTYHNASGYIQAVVTYPSPTVFMGLFVPGNVSVTASAIAGTTPSPACLYILDNKTGDSDVIYTQHTITATNCGVQVNSPNAQATCDHGSGKVVASYLHIVGGQDTSGGCKLNTDTPVSTGVLPVGDPLNNLTGPNPNTDCTGANTTTLATVSSAAQLVGPTQNADGIASDAVYCFSAAQVNLDGGKTALNLGPGIYVFKNGVTIGNLNVNGGTLDIAGGYFSQANATLNITAPANKSAIYNGIAIMYPSTNTTGAGHKCDTTAPCLQLQFGSGSENLSGIVYAPTAEVIMQDMGGSVTAAGIIAWQLGYINTDLTITDSYNHSNATTTPLSTVSLVE